MNVIQKLMGRRQFLAAAGVTSASALALGQLGRVIDPIFQTSAAMAGEKAATMGAKATTNKYPHLLSPIKIGNVILKNRMIHSRSLPHFLQGPETFPGEAIISHYAGVARNGAAIVTVKGGHALTDRKILMGDMAHMAMWDADDPGVQNYLAQLADAIHFYGSKASVGLNIAMPSGYSISASTGDAGGGPGEMPGADMPGAGMPGGAGGPGEAPGGVMPGGPGEKPEGAASGAGLGAVGTFMIIDTGPGKEIPVDLIQGMIEDAAKQARFYQNLGFDMVNIYMPYRAHMLARALSPAFNKRTDKYGGSLENRARFPLEMFQAIKKACGQDFLIEAQISGEEVAGGYTLEDVVQYAKIWEGSLDILQLRAADATASHPMGWNSQKKNPLTLKYAEAIKKSGVKIVTAAIGGFQDPDLNEEFLATGKTDMIAMARAFICDSEYGKKASEGRAEDVVPCIRCNKCHGDTTWLSFCSVNPELGIAHRLNRMIEPPVSSKKVAVIGGGPAGMKAAIVAAERGHKVTLYEKNDFLGGLLRHTDFASFQWPIRDYKDYLIRQMNKEGIHVLLKTEATPDMIQKKGYDAVLFAAGTEPVIPKVPGADGSNVWNVVNVYGNEKALGKNVVVIGGGRGAETGLHLSQCGHKVTVLASGRQLVQQEGPHQGINFQNTDNFSYILQATTTRISNGKATYKDAKGEEKSIQVDDVVVFGGFKPRKDEAMKFAGVANQFFIIGDCTGNGGDIRKCNRIAFAAASRI
jgi:2,4-dienoyl-CoA reductase-like NADH-dependent reductase (Old Yellow Enzyme family)/thioredoxin reductase